MAKADKVEETTQEETKEETKKEGKKVKLKFSGAMTPYVKGDIAGMTEEVAKPYIKAGVAEVIK